jgi:riboflavin kinase/FMN adenylyltransferase
LLKNNTDLLTPVKIYNDIKDFQKERPAVVTVGTFDGLHIGHRRIIEKMKIVAQDKGYQTVVVTFDPHPRLVLYPGSPPVRFITTREQRYNLFDSQGIDILAIIPFTKEFSRIPPSAFIKEYLVELVGAKAVVVGYDHHFGRNRQGNYHLLEKIGADSGIELFEVPAEFVNNIPVSSTKIRNALAAGDIPFAKAMLGYDYRIRGRVVEGNKVGQKIGFPTANLHITDPYFLLPANGVYACKVNISGEIYTGMANIGTRPTVGGDTLTTEVHIFDFWRDLYGEEIVLLPAVKLRDEIRFGSFKELTLQLEKDRVAARSWFADHPF